MSGLKEGGVRLVVEGAKEFDQQLKDASRSLSLNHAEMKKLSEEYGKGSKSVDYYIKKQEILNKQLENQQKRTEALRKKLSLYEKSGGGDESKVHKMRLQIANSEAQEAKFVRQIRETGQELEKTNKALEETAKSVEKTANAVDGASNSLNEMDKNLASSNSRMNAFAASADKIGAKLSKAGSAFTRGITLPIVGAFTYAAKEAIQFDEAYKNVLKTVNADDGILKKLKEDIKDLSISGLVTQGKEDIAIVASEAGQLGIHIDKIMGFSRAVLQLRDATNLGDDAAEQLAQFANITGMSQDKFSNLGSAIVDLGNNLATKEKPIMDMAMNIGAAGKFAKMSVPAMIGMSAAFASLGLEAEKGGTAISKSIIDIDTAVARGGNQLNKYAKIAGMSVREFRRLWNEDSAKGYTAFIKGLQDIEKSGGNVALTLEGVGIKNQGMRDTLMRAAGAGDLLESALLRSNKAYKENTALAEESAKKNESYAARLKILKNRFDGAAESFGESLMPTLEKGMEWLNQIIAGFGKLDESQRGSIITAAMWAAGMGPALKVAGNLVKGVGAATKALQFLFSSGLGPLSLVAVGVTGVIWALSKLSAPVDEFSGRMKNLEFKFNEEALQRLREGIQQGISAANQEYKIKVAVKAEIDEISENIDGAMKDGKISYKEKNSLKKQLNALIKASVDEARIDLEKSVNRYKETLNGLKDAEGNDIFTAEEKAQIISNIGTKTNELTTKLEEYQKEYNNLIEAIYKGKKPATEQQMADLDLLLKKIASVRAEIKIANNEAYQAMQVQADLTKAGKGNEKTAGVAIGYEKEMHEIRQKEAAEEKDKKFVNIANLPEEKKLAAGQAIIEEYQDRIEESSLEYMQEVGKILEGVSKSSPELAEKIKSSVRAIELYTKVQQRLKDNDAEFKMWTPDNSSDILTHEALSRYVPNLVSSDIRELGARGVNIESVANMLSEALLKDIASAAENLSLENPISDLLKSMLEKDIKLDPGLASGFMADVMLLLDFTGKGEEFGLDFVEGISTKLKAPEEIDKVKDGAKILKNSINAGLGNIAGDGYAKGAAYGSSLAHGLRSSYAEIKAAAASLGIASRAPSLDSRTASIGAGRVSVISTSMLKTPKLASNERFDFDLTGKSGAYERAMNQVGKAAVSNSQVVQNINESVNLNAQNIYVKKESDIRAIATETAALKRRVNSSYGTYN